MQSNRNNSVLKEDKAKRLGEALRKNLHRRKAQKREEKDDGQEQRDGSEDKAT